LTIRDVLWNYLGIIHRPILRTVVNIITRKFEAHIRLIEAELQTECNAAVTRAMASMHVLADLAAQSGVILDIDNHIARFQARMRPAPDLSVILQSLADIEPEVTP